MSTIHVSTGSGQTSQYDEDQVRSLLQQGLLSDDALFWREGMKDWQPLRTLFSQPLKTQQEPPPIPHVPASSSYSFVKNPLGLTKVLKVMLWIELGVVFAGLLSDFGQMILLGSDDVSIEAANANDTRQAVIAFIYLGVFIPTAIVFLKWIYRANLNCRGFGATDMQFTPGWSIGYYFIPILNLFRPYQVMKEIWKVSGNPRNWKTEEGGAILGLWWALWLIAGIFEQLAARMSMSATSASALEAATVVSIVSSIVEILLIIVAMTLISRIVEKQVNLTRDIG